MHQAWPRRLQAAALCAAVVTGTVGAAIVSDRLGRTAPAIAADSSGGVTNDAGSASGDGASPAAAAGVLAPAPVGARVSAGPSNRGGAPASRSQAPASPASPAASASAT